MDLTQRRIIGKNILVLLYENNMTQAELARRSGCSPSMISKIVNGTKKPPLEKFVSIAGVLGVTMDALYSDKN